MTSSRDIEQYKGISAYDMPNGITYIGRRDETRDWKLLDVITVPTCVSDPGRWTGNSKAAYRHAYWYVLNMRDDERKALPTFAIGKPTFRGDAFDLDKVIASYDLGK
jgi:hypothetical protein